MRRAIPACCWILLAAAWPAAATTISVVPVFEPVSLHGTDVDGGISDTGEALQATVVSRPMALTGAFPEDIVAAIRTPHKLPTNNPNYKVGETNLLLLCGIPLKAVATSTGHITVTLDTSKLVVPDEVDLTPRQVTRLALLAVRKTLEAYQAGQRDPLQVKVTVTATEEDPESLAELSDEYELRGGAGRK